MAEVSPAKAAKLAATEVFFANGLLTRERHQRFVDNIDEYARVANIPVEYVYAPMSAVCGGPEVEWVRNFPTAAGKSLAGLAYFGKRPKDLEIRMKTIVGALLRNYVDARFMTVQTVLDDLKHNDPPTCRALVIPNFFIGSDKAGVQRWQMAELYDLLLRRHAAGLKSVVYARSLSELRTEHGDLLADHLESHYVGVSI
jgi:hypothetical protein